MSKKDLDKSLKWLDRDSRRAFGAPAKPLKPFEPIKFGCPLHGIQDANANGGCPVPGCPYSNS